MTIPLWLKTQVLQRKNARSAPVPDDSAWLKTQTGMAVEYRTMAGRFHMDEDARRIVDRFGMTPHPEGGWFREVWRSPLTVNHSAIPAGRPSRRCGGTLIYFLLSGDDFSAFHRVRWTDELWHLYAGGPLELHTIDARRSHVRHLLTTDLEQGEPTALIPGGDWQAARLATGARWAFGGCTVAPGFEFADFEMPPAAVLLAEYPEHAAIIGELTRRQQPAPQDFARQD